MKKILFFVLMLSLVFVFCKKEEELPTVDCTGSTPTYTNDVKAILDANCSFAGCHDATTKSEGLDYSSYAQAKTHASHNHFLGSVNHLSGYKAMPKNSDKLSAADIQTLSCWVQNGLPQ
jgi:cytochrome c553